MRKVLLFAIILPMILFGQFRNENSDVNINTGFIKNSTSSFVQSFLDMNKFHMSHSVSMSYASMGDQGVALGVYTNNMMYQFNDRLDFQAAVSFVNSPYSTYGKNFQNSLNGVYLNKAQLNYRPTDNTLISLTFSQMPYSSYYGYGNGWGRGYYDSFWGYSSPFGREF